MEITSSRFTKAAIMASDEIATDDICSTGPLKFDMIFRYHSDKPHWLRSLLKVAKVVSAILDFYVP